jgi:iron complex outermembrane receptor protein
MRLELSDDLAHLDPEVRAFGRAQVLYTTVEIQLRICLTTVLLATLMTANLAVAQESANSDPQTVSGEAPEGAAAATPPENVEVIRVLGPSQSEIDTSAATSSTRFDAETLQALGAVDISDLAQITPNLEIRTAGATAPTFFIRGVGLSDFNANAGGAVAVYQDGVAMNSPALQLGQLFDIAGVEVLRGPQGSGAGRNASAGAIKVESVKPTGEFNSNLSASYGNYNALDLEGAVEAPIFEETLAARLSFRLSERDGWGKNGCGNLPSSLAERDALEDVEQCRKRVSADLFEVPGGLPTSVNDVGTWAARGIFRFQPDRSDTDWLLIARGGRIDQLATLGQTVGTVPQSDASNRSGGYGGGKTGVGYRDPDITEMRDKLIDECQAAGGGSCPAQADDALETIIARNQDIRPERGDYNRVGKLKHDTWGVSLAGEIPVGDLKITTISAYDSYDRSRDVDNDFSPIELFESETEDDAWQFSQEIRVEGELEEHPFYWETGGYYLMEKLDSKADFFQGRRFTTTQEYQQDTYSFAFYGSFGWEFLDDFKLEGGVRYNWEKKEFEFGLKSFRELASFNDTEVWQAPTGTLSLSYQPRDDVSIYFKYSRGWKGGQFNASTGQLVGVEPAEPESIDAWEMGMNGYLLEGRLGLSAALFFYKYSDYQVFIIENNLGSVPQVQIINASEAQIYGAELEARAEPLIDLVPEEFDGLLLTVRFGWLESKFLDFTNEVAITLPTGLGSSSSFPVTSDFSGNQLINAPRFKISLGAEWQFELGRWGNIIPRYDGTWSDEVFFDPAEGRGTLSGVGEPSLPKLAIGQKDFWLHNLSFRYLPPIPNLEIMGWVRNLTDESYRTFAFDGSVFADLTVNYVGEPRTYGATLSYFY